LFCLQLILVPKKKKLFLYTNYLIACYKNMQIMSRMIKKKFLVRCIYFATWVIDFATGLIVFKHVCHPTHCKEFLDLSLLNTLTFHLLHILHICCVPWTHAQFYSLQTLNTLTIPFVTYPKHIDIPFIAYT
jgi:hypothetical protein